MWTLREAHEEDVAQINDIVNWYIRETTANWSWTERPMEEAIEWFHSHNPPRHPVYVIEDGGEIVAFGSLSPFRPKIGYWPVAENSVYVRPGCKGHGMGKALMERLIDDARKSGLRVITAWIDADNQDSVRFHEKLGFYHNGRMDGIGEKFNRRLSVVIMQMDLEENKNGDQ